MSDQTENTEAAAPAASPELSIQDLQALKTIIDVASQRGAFKPNEMVVVGQTYTKLEQFLAAIPAQKPGTAPTGE
jgi:hypothetical protein